MLSIQIGKSTAVKDFRSDTGGRLHANEKELHPVRILNLEKNFGIEETASF